MITIFIFLATYYTFLTRQKMILCVHVNTFPKINPKTSLPYQLRDTVYRGDDINTSLSSVWRKTKVDIILRRLRYYGLSIFIREGILDGSEERLDCICVCNILCL